MAGPPKLLGVVEAEAPNPMCAMKGKRQAGAAEELLIEEAEEAAIVLRIGCGFAERSQ